MQNSINLNKYFEKYKIKSVYTKTMIKTAWEKILETNSRFAEDIKQSLKDAEKHGKEVWELLFAPYMVSIWSMCEEIPYSKDRLCRKILPMKRNLQKIIPIQSPLSLIKEAILVRLDAWKLKKMYLKYMETIGEKKKKKIPGKIKSILGKIWG